MKKRIMLFTIVSILITSISLQRAIAQSWNITGNSNATGTSKLGTTNLVPIKLFTNNAERMRIDSIGRVGIGINPVNILTVKSSGATPTSSWLAGLNSPIFMGFAENVSSEHVLATASNTPTSRSIFHGRRSRGTLASPAVVANNDYLTSLLASGYDGSTYQNPAGVSIFVDGVPSAGNVPARISFVTGSNATNRLERLKVGSTGNFTFNNNQLFLQQSNGSIGIGTITPNASSLLEVNSTTKGILTSRMTQAQRDAIVSPAAGLLIYQTNNTPGFYYYTGSAWTAVKSTTGTGSGWSLTGNAGTSPATNFIGTTDAQPLVFKVNNRKSGYIDNIYGNAAFGYQSLFSNTTGGSNTAIGSSALYNNGTGANVSLDEGTRNTAVGASSMYSNTTGLYNTALGSASLYANTSGYFNTAIGLDALHHNIDGNNNTATGLAALDANTNGNYNTATGSRSLTANTTGSNNVANGFSALYSNKTGYYNTAVGDEALYSNVSGNNNVAHGYKALYSNTGNNNTATGVTSLYSNTTGYGNTANGLEALHFNTTGSNNTATGLDALLSSSTGSDNTAFGFEALLLNTSSYNTAVGYRALVNNVNGFNNTSIGIEADVSAGGLINSTAIGANTIVNASNKIRLGDGFITVVESNAGSWTVSDGRFKNNIAENVKGLEFIKLLKPVTYNFDASKFQEFLLQSYPDSIKTKRLAAMNKSAMAKATEQLQSGFVAQDVAEAAKKIGYDFNGVHAPDNSTDNWSLSYEKLVIPLVKAVQELSKMNDDKDAKIDAQDKKIGELQKQMEQLKAMVLSGNSNNILSAVLSNASLEQNKPNPFANNTSIGYNLPENFTNAKIVITDKSGKTLKLVNITGKGKGTLNVDAAILSSGAYNYSLFVNGKLVGTKQMERIK